VAVEDLDLLRAVYRRLDREGVVYDNPGVSDQDIKDFFRRLKGLLEQSKQTSASPTPPLPPSPTPPPTADPSGLAVVAHCDGGSRGNPGPAGFGYVILGQDQSVLAKGKGFVGHVTNNVAEYRGAIAALARAREMGAASITLKSDSELMVHQINGRYRVKKDGLIPLHAQVKELLSGFAQWKAVHVPREENSVADGLANEAMDQGC